MPGPTYYTALTGLGITNLMQTVTHSLGITPANLIARIIIHQASNTCTAPPGIGTIGTNIITISSGVGTLQTCDLEVQQVSSIIS
jgi:hypothetical protein